MMPIVARAAQAVRRCAGQRKTASTTTGAAIALSENHENG